MLIREVRALRGPNIWGRVPVLEVVLGLDGEGADASVDRIVTRLPELEGRLDRTASPPERLAALTVALQALAGSPVSAWSVAPAGDASATFAAEIEEEPLGRACLEAALDLIRSAADDTPFDGPAVLHDLKEKAYFACLGTSTRALVDAARDRDIPCRRLNEGSLVLLGQGARQRRILTAETDRTSAIAESIAQDKELTRELLRSVGVPAPSGRAVDSADDAWEAAQEVGLPVVVKPRNANHARGVATNLTTREQVIAAYQAAVPEGDGVLVERYAPGMDHRLLVVGGRLIAAARREPARIIGDGRSTVRELVEQINADPRRGDGFTTPLGRIPLDEPAVRVLAEQGFCLDSVPPSGVAVTMRRQSHIITGGAAFDVTARVHPEVAARAVDAARVVGLDVAGIDIVAEDVGRPLEDQGGVVVEVNAGPGLGLHLPPWADPSRQVGPAILGLAFPEGDGRIPIVAITGSRRGEVAREVARLLGSTGLMVGLAGASGLAVGGRTLSRRPADGPAGALGLLMHPHLELAVLEVAPASIRGQGLGIDRCHVAVLAGPEDPEAERVLADAAGPRGVVVLDLDHPAAGTLAGPAILLADDPADPRLADHRARGGAIVAGRSCSFTMERDGSTIAIDASGDRSAVAAAWALGLEPEAIRAYLASDGDAGGLPTGPNRASAQAGASNIA